MRTPVLLVGVFVLATAAVEAANHDITVDDNFFSPAMLTIQVGDSVTWSNVGNMAHNVAADDGSFRNGNVSSAAWTFTMTFEDPGEVGYFCEAHGAPGIGMAGTIIVEQDDPPPPEPGDAYVVNVPIAGSVQGNNAFFRTFLRIFNPSPDETVAIGGAFLPVGQDNSSAPEMVTTVGPREVQVFEDVVGTLFSSTGLGAIRFHADRPFSITSRIFTDSNCESPTGGTFGQFVTGVDESTALLEGAILHLQVTDDFRSNVGFHNPNLEAVMVTMTLHGSEGVLAGPTELTLQPREPLGPTALANLFGLASIDDGNLWIEFSATRPVHGYGSVVDEVTQDQFFIHASGIDDMVDELTL